MGQYSEHRPHGGKKLQGSQEEHTGCCQRGRRALVTSPKVSSSTNIQGKLTHLGVNLETSNTDVMEPVSTFTSLR